MDREKGILDLLVDQLKNLYKHSVGYYITAEKNVHNLTEEMKKLAAKRDDTMRSVESAERQGLQRTNEVKLWLEGVQALQEEVSRMDAEFRALSKCCNTDYPLNVVSGCLLSKNAEEKLGEVRGKISSRAEIVQVADEPPPVSARGMPIVPNMGLESLDKALNDLRGTEEGVVGIYGMGGVGKTTLLKRFNNELRKEAHYLKLIVMFVEVSENPDVQKIQKMIVSRLGLRPWQEDEDVEERAIEILEALSKIQFVIMLDDVWEPLDLSSIGIPAPGGGPLGSKIVVASRIEDVCTRMEAQRVINIECLGWEEAWCLFLEKAGKEGKRLVSSHAAIEGYAKAIVRKCGGLPVALTTMGLAMAAKRSPPEWRHAVWALDNTPAEIQGMESEVLRRLMRSFNNLPNDKLRRSLLYFVLYQEASQISTRDIVTYWIGEAIIDEFDDICEASVEGHDITCRLKRACLLESTAGEDHVRMHSMIRSMAMWVATDGGKVRDKWLAQPGRQLREAPELERWRAAERISLTGNYISSIPAGVPQCPNLLSLMLNDNKLLGSLPSGFFQVMPLLRVLDLSNTSIEELPPDIDKLVELQFLDLSDTKLHSVPSQLGKLGKLRVLDLSRIPTLKTFPGGVMEGLSAELRVLRMFESYGSWATDAAADGGTGGRFEELEGLRRLKMLMISLETAEALRRLAGSYRLAVPTHTLHLRGLQGTATIRLPSDLGSDMIKLKQLCISHSHSMEEVILDDDDRSWSNIPHFDFLRFEMLHNANIIFKVMPSGCMRGLETLEVRDCPVIEQLIGEAIEGGEAFVLPRLRFFHLINLPKLRSICGSTLTLPSLMGLKVYGCPKLKRLPFGQHSCRMLEEIQGPTEWWDQLEWDDAATRDLFQPVFYGPFCRRCHHRHD